MPVFIVAAATPEKDPIFKSRISEHFPADNYQIGRGQWLVAFNGTAKALFDKLAQGNRSDLEESVVFGINGYYGFASTDIWEWIASKLKEQNA